MVLPEAVARRFWAYGTLGKTPDEDKWTKLDKDVREVALNMSPDDIGTCMWALGTIRKMPTNGTWTVLEIAVEDTASEMSAKSVAVCVWAYARLVEAGLRKPDADAWRELESAVEKHALAGAFANEDLVNILHAFVTLPREPPKAQAAEGEEGEEVQEDAADPPPAEPPAEGEEGAEAPEPEPVVDDVWNALEAAAARVAPAALTATELATTLWIYSTMRKQPEETMWEALDAGVERVAPALKGTKQLAQMAWFYHSLDRRPSPDATRWLMHNAVLLQPTGLQRVGLTRETNAARAASRMQKREASEPASIDAQGWLKWAMNEPEPVPPAKHALTFDPDAKPEKGEEDAEGDAEGDAAAAAE